MLRNKYNETFGITQSSIKDFRFKSPTKWREIWINKQEDLDKNENSFIFGSLVDMMLFSPELVKEHFYIGNEPKLPSQAVIDILKDLYKSINKQNEFIETNNENLPVPEEKLVVNIESNLEMLLEIIKKHEWYSNLTDSAKIKKILTTGVQYFEHLILANDKKIISLDMYNEAVKSVELLKKEELSSVYLVPSKDIELIFQLEIFSNYTNSEGNSVPVKGAIDILQIDHDLKTVKIVDFKTTFSGSDFLKSIKQYDYCSQLSFYDFLLRNWIEENRKDLKDYNIIRPINLVFDYVEKNTYIYEYDWADLTISKEGNKQFLYSLFQTHNHPFTIKKGWQELLDEIVWHYTYNRWKYSKEMYQYGKIKVNLLN